MTLLRGRTAPLLLARRLRSLQRRSVRDCLHARPGRAGRARGERVIEDGAPAAAGAPSQAIWPTLVSEWEPV